MSISQHDASDALRLVDEVGSRSTMLRRYKLASPHLILWGIVYFGAYSYGNFRPEQSGWVWLVVVPLAILGDLLISRHDKAGALTGAEFGTFAGVFMTFFAFIGATAVIMQPHDPRQMAAFVPLLVSAVYIIMGLAQGRRLALAGVALGTLTLVGYFALPDNFMIWMAAVGGSALVGSGVWLRSV